MAKENPKAHDPLKDIVALCKRRGFVFPGSEIYGGLSNTYDYGPYGVEVLKNLKDAWWQAFVRDRDDIVGLDSSIMLHPRVWEASGHVGNFNDPLVDCTACKARVRADQYVEEFLGPEMVTEDLEALQKLFHAKHAELQCPTCGKKGTFTEPRQFNLMFQTRMGSVSGTDQQVYLRPETAQGIFINFKNISDSCRVKVPFGVAQIGKSFRNEIIARQFVFRTREFEQMEMEFFCKPGTQKEWFEYWVEFCMHWLEEIGLKRENLRVRSHSADELSFYSDNTVDIEYKFPFGWGEIWGIASRTNYDLTQHADFSKKNLTWHDPETNEKYLPYVVEPALGLNRLLLAVLCDAFAIEHAGSKEERRILQFAPAIAPVKVGIFPLQKKDGLLELAQDLYQDLRRNFLCELDSSGSIGKRYFRQDECGTPLCITVDYESKDDQCVTVRHRDSTRQERVAIADLKDYISKALAGGA
ncbi:MAG: glycine--tRNA ligase [Leptospiraceae bacterium]|nr:glycine--tRNA ligase [Leptospiraceae bacterium]